MMMIREYSNRVYSDLKELSQENIQEYIDILETQTITQKSLLYENEDVRITINPVYSREYRVERTE